MREKEREEGRGRRKERQGKGKAKLEGIIESEWYIESKWVDRAARRANAISWAYVEERGRGSQGGAFLSGLARSSE